MKLNFILYTAALYSFCGVYVEQAQSNRQDHTKDMTTSIIIPCHPHHACHLYDLILLYEEQTVLPDEIVISLSQANQVSEEIIQNIESTSWAFPVKLLKFDKKLYAGQNHNRACYAASGDIFICQDADDLPHPQRVEIIRYFFETHKPDFIMHEYLPLKAEETPSYAFHEDLSQIKYMRPQNHLQIEHIPITNGNIAIAQHVFLKKRWLAQKSGQDVAYCRKLFGLFENRYIIQTPLLMYRNYLSSAPYK